jgi:general stress protein 26
MVPTDPELEEILEGCMVARLATMSRSGRPHVNPIYFVVDDGKLHLGTSTSTLAARNVVANPKVQVLLDVESDSSHGRMARVTGQAVVLTDPGVLRDYKRRDARKYFRSLRSLWMSLTHLRQLFLTTRYLSSDDPATSHCIIEIDVTEVELLANPT